MEQGTRMVTNYSRGFSDGLKKVAVSSDWVWRKIRHKVPNFFRPAYERTMRDSLEGLRTSKGKFSNKYKLKAEKALLRAGVAPLRHADKYIEVLGKKRGEQALEALIDKHTSRAARHLMGTGIS